MLVICCRCQSVGVELDDELYEDDGQGEFPMAQPVPDGWFPDPETDDGVICPDCLTDEERREASREHQHTVRVLLGEFD